MPDFESGVVVCRESLESDAVELDLRRGYDGIQVDDAKVQTMLQLNLKPLPHPKSNAEKIDMTQQSSPIHSSRVH